MKKRKKKIRKIRIWLELFRSECLNILPDELNSTVEMIIPFTASSTQLNNTLDENSTHVASMCGQEQLFQLAFCVTSTGLLCDFNVYQGHTKEKKLARCWYWCCSQALYNSATECWRRAAIKLLLTVSLPAATCDQDERKGSQLHRDCTAESDLQRQTLLGTWNEIKTWKGHNWSKCWALFTHCGCSLAWHKGSNYFVNVLWCRALWHCFKTW